MTVHARHLFFTLVLQCALTLSIEQKLFGIIYHQPADNSDPSTVPTLPYASEKKANSAPSRYPLYCPTAPSSFEGVSPWVQRSPPPHAQAQIPAVLPWPLASVLAAKAWVHGQPCQQQVKDHRLNSSHQIHNLTSLARTMTLVRATSAFVKLMKALTNCCLHFLIRDYAST